MEGKDGAITNRELVELNKMLAAMDDGRGTVKLDYGLSRIKIQAEDALRAFENATAPSKVIKGFMAKREQIRQGFLQMDQQGRPVTVSTKEGPFKPTGDEAGFRDAVEEYLDENPDIRTAVEKYNERYNELLNEQLVISFYKIKGEYITDGALPRKLLRVLMRYDAIAGEPGGE